EDGGTFPLVNTIIAGNFADLYPDVRGQFDSYGHDLIGDGTGASGFINSDLVGTSTNPIDPMLSPLGFYGGPTQTHLLLPGSPALAAGDIAFAALPYDQRGYDRIVNGSVDIGAVEMPPVHFNN